MAEPTPIAQPEAAASDGQVTKAALLAEIENLAEPANGAPPPEKAPEPAAEETPADDPSEADTQDEPIADPAGGDESEDEDEPEEPTKTGDGKPADADLDKRLATVQKAQKRAKDELARERADFDRERDQWKASWQPKIEQAERFLALAGRAKYDPVSVLLALGLSDDDLEPAARQVYAHSKAAAADPRYKESATRLMRERQYADELAQTRKELQDMKSQIQQRDQAQAAEREATRYIDSVVKVTGEETPLVQTMLAKNAERTRERLAQTAMRIIEETGEAPDPEDVVKSLEQARRLELEELGIDLDVAIKTAAPKKTIPAAGETRTAKTLSNGLGKPAQPRAAQKSRRDEIADLRRDLESGRLE